MKKREYRFSPSLLQSIDDFGSLEVTYDKFWGKSDHPSMSFAQFEAKAKKELVDYLNGVQSPETEATAFGSALNEVVDRLIGADPNEDFDITQIDGAFRVDYKGFHFLFNYNQVMQLADIFENSLPQYHLSSTFETDNGRVILHGFADYIFPDYIVDLKTTSKYSNDKFLNGMQRFVYPLLALESGDMTSCNRFRYHILQKNKPDKNGIYTWTTFVEEYQVEPDNKERVLGFITNCAIPLVDNFIENGLVQFPSDRIKEI